MELHYTNGGIDKLEEMLGNSFLMILQKPTLKNLAMLTWAGTEGKSVDEVRELMDKERADGTSTVDKQLEAVIKGLQEGGFLGKDFLDNVKPKE